MPYKPLAVKFESKSSSCAHQAMGFLLWFCFCWVLVVSFLFHVCVLVWVFFLWVFGLGVFLGGGVVVVLLLFFFFYFITESQNG